MTTENVDELVALVLHSIRPRPGFASELEAAIRHEPPHPYVIAPYLGRSRTRWVVVGAVAGVASATGAVYWGTRRRQHRGAA